MSCLAEKGVNTIGESSFHSELINYNNVKQKSVLMFTTKWKNVSSNWVWSRITINSTPGSKAALARHVVAILGQRTSDGERSWESFFWYEIVLCKWNECKWTDLKTSFCGNMMRRQSLYLKNIKENMDFLYIAVLKLLTRSMGYLKKIYLAKRFLSDKGRWRWNEYILWVYVAKL